MFNYMTDNTAKIAKIKEQKEELDMLQQKMKKDQDEIGEEMFCSICLDYVF